MFGFPSKRLQSLLSSCSLVVESVTRLHCLHETSHFSGSYSSQLSLGSELLKSQKKDGSFTVSFLVNSCGLSPEQALSASKRVHFDNGEGAESVLKYLREYGFDDTCIAQLVQKRPKVLLKETEKSLLPKLEFFRSIGLSDSAIAGVICYNPTILQRSLEKCLRPCYDVIKSLHFANIDFVHFFRKYRMLSVKSIANIPLNVSVLREMKVLDSTVSRFVGYYPFLMSLDSEKFNRIVEKVQSMGLQPSSPQFMTGLKALVTMDSSKWEKKMEIYRSCGWTEDDFLVAFRKNPMFMVLSEKNFSNKMDFIVNKMACAQPAYLANNPTVLTYSLENGLKPRCLVLRVLLLKCLITRRECNLSTIVSLSKKKFLDKFVLQYQEQVPDLPRIFFGKTGLAELDLGFENC